MRPSCAGGCICFGHYFPSFSEGLSLRPSTICAWVLPSRVFPFLFGGTFIEADGRTLYQWNVAANFPSFSEGLSLRHRTRRAKRLKRLDFPSFSEGLSLRREAGDHLEAVGNFPSFSEGLSLRHCVMRWKRRITVRFPFLFGGTFIEAG